MKKSCFCLLSFFLAVLFTGGGPAAVRAQKGYGEYARMNGLRALEIGKALSRMAERGDRPEDFVPPHWAIHSRAEGDLNADGVADFAFILTLDERDAAYLESLSKLEANDQWIDETFIIVVADSRGDRRRHLGEVNYQLFGDSGASVRGDERNEFRVEIKKNVLSVNLDYGGMNRSEATFHFRMEPQTGGPLRLIGFDFGNTCVTLTESCNKWEFSENYLTGARVETDYKFVRDRMVGADKRSQIPLVEVDFMNARLNHGNRKANVRPF